jgi:hypothetical protein
MSDLTDEELTGLSKRYGDKTPKHSCPVCKGTDWALEGGGMGRLTWACNAAKPAHHGGTGVAMEWDHYSRSSHEVSCGDEDVISLIEEIRRHRSALAADEERVRSVVRAEMNELIANDGPVTTPEEVDYIATRAAKQLATAAVRLSEDERNHLLSIRSQLRCSQHMWRSEIATLDRLLVTGDKP